MDIAKILSGSIGGTSLMSLFSYLISDSKHKNFKEPEILGELLNRIAPDLSEKQANLAGWALHFGAGAAFTTIYDQIWEKTSIKPDIKSGAIMGAISGLIGIAVWRATIAMHPNPPIKNYTAYYKHLILAHVFFGIAAAESYKHTKSLPAENKNLDEKIHNQ